MLERAARRFYRLSVSCVWKHLRDWVNRASSSCDDAARADWWTSTGECAPPTDGGSRGPLLSSLRWHRLGVLCHLGHPTSTPCELVRLLLENWIHSVIQRPPLVSRPVRDVVQGVSTDGRRAVIFHPSCSYGHGKGSRSAKVE